MLWKIHIIHWVDIQLWYGCKHTDASNINKIILILKSMLSWIYFNLPHSVFRLTWDSTSNLFVLFLFHQPLAGWKSQANEPSMLALFCFLLLCGLICNDTPSGRNNQASPLLCWFFFWFWQIHRVKEPSEGTTGFPCKPYWLPCTLEEFWTKDIFCLIYICCGLGQGTCFWLAIWCLAHLVPAQGWDPQRAAKYKTSVNPYSTESVLKEKQSRSKQVVVVIKLEELLLLFFFGDTDQLANVFVWQATYKLMNL